MATWRELWIWPPPPPRRSRRHPKQWWYFCMSNTYWKLESIHWTLTSLGICTCFRPYQTRRQRLVHLKNRVEPDRHTGVVYSIPCRSYTKVYIGHTGHTLEHCLREHKRALVSREVNVSAVVQHEVDEGHGTAWSSATVIDRHPNFHQTSALDVWHIGQPYEQKCGRHTH